MTLIIPPGFGQATLVWALTGDPEEMLSTFGFTTASTAATPDDAAEFLADQFSAAGLDSGGASNYEWRGVRVAIGQDGGPPAVGEAIRSVVGAGSPSTLPQNVALLVRKSTGLGGRANRGRMYLPPYLLNEGAVSATGIIDGASRSGVQDALDEWFALFDMVILHDSESPVLTPTAVTSLVLDDQVATQRRRLR